MALDLRHPAQRYVNERFPGRRMSNEISLRLDRDYCAEVGRLYESEPEQPASPQVLRGYDAFKSETADQFAAMTSAGITVRPWLRKGQPYASSRDLREQVTSTSTLYVFLTRGGHGPCSDVNLNHPMCEESGITIEGERLFYNDLFRAVHDAFGHVMNGNDFSIGGEFKATFDHLQMYSAVAQPVVFTETIGQICWFYHGPHLLGQRKQLLLPGEQGYKPPRERSYPLQKVFVFPTELMNRYEELFERRLTS